MTELLTSAQMRAIEQAAIDSGDVTGLELMERAGQGVIEAILEEWPELAAGDRKAVVLCGPGNNGGDGFVVARLLAEREWEVEVFLYGEEAKLPRDAAENCRQWKKLGNLRQLETEMSQGEVKKGEKASYNHDLFVDALFGIGLTRKLPPVVTEFLLEMAANRAKDFVSVAVDVPSGICADSGKMLVSDDMEVGGFFRQYDLTVTFHGMKPGHFLDVGPVYSGKVVEHWIGILEAVSNDDRHISRADLVDDPRCVLPLDFDKRARRITDFQNKYTHGHALILSGPSGQAGAARLAARGALRIGAGLVTIGCPPDALAEHAAHLNAIMLKTIATPAELIDCLTDRRINALCLGPGMGVGAATRAMVAAALAAPAAAPGPLGARGPGAGPGLRCTVLDADALSSFAENPAGLFAVTHENTVLTPHGGEFARLFPEIAAKLNTPAIQGPAYSKVDATRDAAKRAGCVVLFKGPDTVIAAPDGRCSINSALYDRAAPWLATAGSGDVLAGFIAGLMARGFAPMQAAETAAWLHVECARSFGPGLIAEDLPEELPKVFRVLGL